MIFINLITDNSIFVEGKKYDWSEIFNIINDINWTEVILICGPSNYVSIRRSIAILKALNVKYNNLKIHYFDILINFLPKESMFINQNIIWHKKDQNIKIIENKIENIDSNLNINCSSEILQKYIQENFKTIDFLDGPKYFDRLTENF